MKQYFIFFLAAMLLASAVFASSFPSDYMGANVITGKLASSTDVVTGSRLAMTVKGTTPSFGSPSYLNGNLTGYGTIFQIKRPHDMLEGAEYVSDVISSIDKTDTGLLKDQTFYTSQGSYVFQQFLDTPYQAASTYEYARGVPYDMTNTPAAYMLFPKDAPVYSYTATFLQEAVSKVDSSANDYKLKDFEDGTLNLLGKDFTILKAEHPAANSIKLTLLGGSAKETLLTGDKKDYAINGTMYTIEVVAFADQGRSVYLNVNGQPLHLMRQGDTERIGSLDIAISDIISKGEKSDVPDRVVLYLESYKLELADTDTTSLTSGGKEMKVNDNYVDDTDVQIMASDPGLVEGSDYRLQKLQVKWNPSTKHYLGTEKYMSDIVEDKNVLFGNLDFYYYGSNPTNDAETIDLVNNGDRRYTLSFENTLGEKMDIPLFYLSSGVFSRFGTDDNDLVVNESMQISQNDYFLVTSDGSALATKAEGVTKLYRYKSQDVSEKTLKFQDMGANATVEARYDNGIAHLHVGGTEILINVTQNISNDGNITVDLDSDGTIDSDVPVLVTRYKQKIVLNTDTFDSFQMVSPKAEEGPALSAWAPLGVTEGHDYTRITVISDSSSRIDVSNVEDCLSFNEDEVLAATGDPSYLESCYYTFTVSPYTLMYQVGDTDVYEGSDSWGQFYEWHKLVNSPDKLYIASTKNQDESLFFIVGKGAAFHDSSDESNNVSAKKILMGGPCVNEDTAKAMGLSFPSCGGSVIKPGSAFIKEYDYNGAKALVVFGYGPEDTINAVNKLMKGLDIPAGGLFIQGDNVSNAPASIAEEKKAEVTSTTTTTTMPEVKKIACSYSPNAKTSYETKARKFGISINSRTDVWVDMQGTKGKLYTKDDKPFQAAFGVDWLDYAMHILKDDCNGQEVQNFTGREVNGDQEFDYDLNLPTEGCYCVKIENKDLVLDSASISILPAGKFEMMFGTG